jgi:hypothetical protein
MFREIAGTRRVIALSIATVVGVWGLREHPMPTDDVFLGLIALQKPVVFSVLSYGYATSWFTVPFLIASMGLSMLLLVSDRHTFFARCHPLPPYPEPETRDAPSLVLGESHLVTRPGPALDPTWLSIPQRGLYTGVMVVGAIGTGKTSACMYPYVEQLLRWRPDDPERKLAALVLEVKGHFCREVQAILQRAGRQDDYVEIGLHSDTCYNPLHNDLDPYAIGFAIASLISNLYGKGKEPFWAQAYTDLLRFVITLRRVADGYTTLAEVYRYVLDNSQIDRDIRRLKPLLAEAPEALIVPTIEHRLHTAQSPWTQWFVESPDLMAHPYDAELEAYLAARHVPYRVQRAEGDGWAARRHQLDAIENWYLHGWTQLDSRLRSSIVQGIAVFLASFAVDPRVHRAFSPPRQAYTTEPAPGQPRPLPPLEDLLESGRIVALNFPMAMNPGLSRALSVMLKLDGQRCVLQRIPIIRAHPERHFRDILLAIDEYQAFCTVGETDPTGDERALALSREAKLIPLVSTQSYSSLRSALPSKEACDTLLQCFRTQIILGTSDEETARKCAETTGHVDRLKATYSLSEAGQGTHVSWLTGRATAARQTLSATKSYAPHQDYLFPPRTFRQLRAAEAIVFPCDGFKQLPPQFCYLKPHFLDVQTSYFDHVARGVL